MAPPGRLRTAPPGRLRTAPPGRLRMAPPGSDSGALGSLTKTVRSRSLVRLDRRTDSFVPAGVPAGNAIVYSSSSLVPAMSAKYNVPGSSARWPEPHGSKTVTGATAFATPLES